MKAPARSHYCAMALATIAVFTSLQCWAAARDLWLQPQEPFRIFGNSYYVGTRGISVVLITSDQGHVLVDAGLAESAANVVANIRTLGFKPEDIKAIFNSHAHSDHAGGLAALQELSGAMVFSSAEGAAALKQGRGSKNDPQYELKDSFPAIAKASAVPDRHEVRAGSIKVTVHYTPGHTPGGTSLTWRSCEGNRCLNLAFADSLNAVSDDTFKYRGDPRWPGALESFRQTFLAVESLPCDILISAHPEFSELWERLERRQAGEPGALIDPSACRRYVAAARERLEKRLASEASL